MLFKILAERNENDKKYFYYDNDTNTLKSESGFVYESGNNLVGLKEYKPFSPDMPLLKSRDVRVLKIQLGLSCNYACEYCSQRFVERPEQTTKKDIDDFLNKMRTLNFSEKNGLKIEIWGGEPFVYWKTMKPLVEALKEEFANWVIKPQFSVITNGSILTDEIINWLVRNDFSISISHDGPGQFVRGPDPLDDGEQKQRLINLYHRLKPHGRMSFNSMLNAQNTSRKKIYDWFVDLTGDENVVLGEGALVDAYDDGAIDVSLKTKEQHFSFRRESFNDIFSTNGKIGFNMILDKVDSFINDVISHKNSKYLNQKCGMDDEHVIAVDLKGNVITCQNVSAVQINSNGKSHLGGTIENIEDVRIESSTHWSKRPDCASCPVLHVCKGSCMFVSDKYWDQTCQNAYSDSVALFALAFERITDGYIPVFIDADHLPDMRKDIWGTVLKHEEVVTSKKIIPITNVPVKKTIIDGIEVYEKS